MTLKGLFNAIQYTLNNCKPDQPTVRCIQPKIDFGSRQLNGLFGCVDENGFCTPDHGITEIVGDPGSGKSQLLMNLAASILSCNPDVSVLYIDTENCITRMRIQEMMTQPLAKHHRSGLDDLA
ncbi:AAA domain protein [Gregarina niphandrodes]|uniref:AAA domain protein n=1 Tax=Gregarina niphandrodes TaxID=110365 RepID=A0A023B8H8_GRENI|nr:AAA domain protein [Gregarina niphandrodes]EZG69105.1 AAA domain protein [Gregarina niphandrodes]|eukprot:XP_011134485.1 AAA domain protein [Gregarina niphandrodes]